MVCIRCMKTKKTTTKNKQKQLETIKFMKKFTSQNDNITVISLHPKCLIINLEIKKSNCQWNWVFRPAELN